jgi:hypothetical protein
MTGESSSPSETVKGADISKDPEQAGPDDYRNKLQEKLKRRLEVQQQRQME